MAGAVRGRRRLEVPGRGGAHRVDVRCATRRQGGRPRRDHRSGGVGSCPSLHTKGVGDVEPDAGAGLPARGASRHSRLGSGHGQRRAVRMQTGHLRRGDPLSPAIPVRPWSVPAVCGRPVPPRGLAALPCLPAGGSARCATSRCAASARPCGRPPTTPRNSRRPRRPGARRRRHDQRSASRACVELAGPGVQRGFLRERTARRGRGSPAPARSHPRHRPPPLAHAGSWGVPGTFVLAPAAGRIGISAGPMALSEVGRGAPGPRPPPMPSGGRGPGLASRRRASWPWRSLGSPWRRRRGIHRR